MEIDSSSLVERVRKDIDSRNQVIVELYKNDKIRRSIFSFVFKNGGNEESANDLLTHAIISFTQQCFSPVFELRHSINTYLYTIARYKWINDHKASSKINLIEESQIPHTYVPSIEDEIIGKERSTLLRKALTQLDEKCRKVMQMWASQLKMREIAIRMSYSSEQMARKKKHQCLQRLKEIVKDI